MSHASIGRVLILFLAIAAAPAFADRASGSFPATALKIVLDTQQAKLQELDSPDSWWHDTKERTWSVRRPFELGVLDTTHTFVVSYSIDGATVAFWQVDTRAGTTVAMP